MGYFLSHELVQFPRGRSRGTQLVLNKIKMYFFLVSHVYVVLLLSSLLVLLLRLCFSLLSLITLVKRAHVSPPQGVVSKCNCIKPRLQTLYLSALVYHIPRGSQQVSHECAKSAFIIIYSLSIEQKKRIHAICLCSREFKHWTIYNIYIAMRILYLLIFIILHLQF